jgi:hypothetical protein
VIVLAFTLLFLTLHTVSIRTEVLRRRADNMSRLAAAGGEG